MINIGEKGELVTWDSRPNAEARCLKIGACVPGFMVFRLLTSHFTIIPIFELNLLNGSRPEAR